MAICSWIKENASWLIPLIITAIFAILNLCLAWSNKKLAENQSRLQNDIFCYQLFEKRMTIYTAIQEILSEIVQQGKCDINCISKFLQCTREVPFFFGEDIVKAIDDIYQLIIELDRYCALVNDAINRQVAPDNHEENCQKEYELKLKVSEVLMGLQDLFKDYISFGTFKIEDIARGRHRKQGC